MRVFGRVLASAGLAMLAIAVPAQTASDPSTPYSVPSASSEDVLREMSARAAVVFVGTVTAVRKPSDDAMRDAAAAHVVEVEFAVDNPVRGTSGATYTMREWAGMWRDSARFTVGQRLLMLLHAPGPGGLTSPVDGLDGAIPVRGTETPGAQSVLHSFAQAGDATSSGSTVDLRWVQAKTLRAQTFADAPTGGPGVTLAGSLTGAPAGTVAQSGTATAVEGPATPAAVAPVAEGLNRVLALLASGQMARSASH